MFTHIKDATYDDLVQVRDECNEMEKTNHLRIAEILKSFKGINRGFPIDQLEHSLQTATRAYRAKESDEFVVCCLIHDIGKYFTTFDHGSIAASIAKPFVSEQMYHILKFHNDFQGEYYFGKIGRNDKLYERHMNNAWFNDAKRFATYDSASFDPNFNSENLEFFLPLLEKVFSNKMLA